MAGTTTPAPAAGGTGTSPAPAPTAAARGWPQMATVVGHPLVPAIADTNKRRGAARALMHVPAARKH